MRLSSWVFAACGLLLPNRQPEKKKKRVKRPHLPP
jgi:hypothetical protein